MTARAPRVLRSVDAGRKPMAGASPTVDEVAHYVAENLLLRELLERLGEDYVRAAVEDWRYHRPLDSDPEEPRAVKRCTAVDCARASDPLGRCAQARDQRNPPRPECEALVRR